MRLNEYGMIVDGNGVLSVALRAEIELDVWVVMPNLSMACINNDIDVGAYGHTPYHDRRIVVQYTIIGWSCNIAIAIETIGAMIAGSNGFD